MRTTTSIPSALLGMAMTFALASAAHASATRTYVSNAGVDSNTASNCPHSAPCKTFAAAYSVTQSGGEIIALDLSTYGPLTITGAVTITAMNGAIITVQTGTVGFTINAGAGNLVTLRNIQISGAAGSSNTTGIQVNSGRLILRNSTISRLTSGLLVVSSKADVIDTEISGNTTGVTTVGTGVDIFNNGTTGNTEVRIWAGSVTTNTAGFFISAPGVDANNNNRLTVFLGQFGNAVNVNTGGNGNLVVGFGTGCSPCTSVWTYQGTSQNASDVPH